MPIEQSRCRLLSQLGVAGIAGLSGIASVGFGVGARSLAAEPAPEITAIKLKEYPPRHMHCSALRSRRDALSAADIRCPTASPNPALQVAQSEADSDTDFAPNIVAEIAKGVPVTIVAGLHLSCYELVARDHVHSLAGLKARAGRLGTLRSRVQDSCFSDGKARWAESEQ